MRMRFTGCSLRSSWATSRSRELGMAQETDPGKNPLLPVHPERPVWSYRELVTCQVCKVIHELDRSEFLSFPVRSCPCSSASTLAAPSRSRCYEPVLPRRMKRVAQSMDPGDATRFCASREKQSNDRLVSVVGLVH